MGSLVSDSAGRVTLGRGYPLNFRVESPRVRGVSAKPSAAELSCRWCGRACRLRRGGSPRVFCGPACRTAYHTAARRWAERAVASGVLTITDIRKGRLAACTLLTGAVSPAPIDAPRNPAPVASPERPAHIVVGLDRMLDMQLRELRWGDPFHLATPEQLAATATTLLRYGVQVMISMPRR